MNEQDLMDVSRCVSKTYICVYIYIYIYIKHIQIQGRSVSILDPVSFAQLVELDRHSTFAQRIAAAEAEEPVGTKKVRSKPSYIVRSSQGISRARTL